MRLLNLNLRKALRYRGGLNADAAAVLAMAVSAAEGTEFLLAWDPTAILATGNESPDGPTLRRPLPPPFFAGIVEAPTADAPAVEVSAAIGADQEPEMVLEMGHYAFTQTRAATIDEATDALEWLLRETWWTGAKTSGPLFLRLVAEDGKLAVQPLWKQEGKQ